jgi:hypothetical protein
MLILHIYFLWVHDYESPSVHLHMLPLSCNLDDIGWYVAVPKDPKLLRGTVRLWVVHEYLLQIAILLTKACVLM